MQRGGNYCELPTRRITKTSYERPNTTYQDTLQTDEAMLEKLAGYEEVTMPEHIEYRVHTRYITYKDGKAKFCLGGLMMRVYPDYVVMSNGTISWSVQRDYQDKAGNSYGKTRFFKYVSKDTRNQLVIQEQQGEIERLRLENERLKHVQPVQSTKPRLF
jgi:hypothetical protein